MTDRTASSPSDGMQTMTSRFMTSPTGPGRGPPVDPIRRITSRSAMMPMMVVSSRVTTRQPMRYWFIAVTASSTLAVSAMV